MKKLNFMAVEKELSREEMKPIMAGSSPGGTNCSASCTTDADCNGGNENSCNTCCNIPGYGRGCATYC